MSYVITYFIIGVILTAGFELINNYTIQLLKNLDSSECDVEVRDQLVEGLQLSYLDRLVMILIWPIHLSIFLFNLALNSTEN